jgi:hypothetical protein
MSAGFGLICFVAEQRFWWASATRNPTLYAHKQGHFLNKSALIENTPPYEASRAILGAICKVGCLELVSAIPGASYRVKGGA